MDATGGEILAQQLATEGVRHIFGVPGVQLDYAMDGLAQLANRISFIVTRHEQSAAYMADGYARSSGEVGVCMVVPGPGLLNASAALSTAYACSAPVVCISGQIPSALIGRGYGVLHEVAGQSRILDSVTKWHALAAGPEDIAPLVREAIKQARSGRPRPVAVEIPPDVLAARSAARLKDPAAGPAAPEVPDPDLVRQAARLLCGASRPAIWTGWGVQAASGSDTLLEVAEALEAPVIMNRSGQGSLSARHHLAVNGLGGRRLLADCDVLLVVGSRFMTGMGRPIAAAPGTKVILVNADPADLGGPRSPEIAILGDARLTLEAIRAELGQLPPRPSRKEELDRIREWTADQVGTIEPQRSWLEALRGGLPDDGFFVNELTQVGYAARVGFPSYLPRTMITPGYQGTLGYGFPTALGVKIAHPGRAVVAIAGDGGFGWAMAELATARKYNIGVVTVVFNDNAFGNVRRTQREDFDGRYIATDLVNPDYVALAESFGVAGYRCETPGALRSQLDKSAQEDEPTLIEVPVGEMPSAWHLLR